MSIRLVLTVLVVSTLLGCGRAKRQKAPGPPGGGQDPKKAELGVDGICDGIDASIALAKKMESEYDDRRAHPRIARQPLEALERIAAADPSVLASAASAAEARKIAAGEGARWPVVEHRGRWYVLMNMGDPASDGCFAVVVIDKKTKSVIGETSDAAGQMLFLAGYEILADPEESPVDFVVTRRGDGWEVGFRRFRKKVQLESISVLHAARPITKTSGPDSAVLSVRYQWRSLADRWKSLGLDFSLMFQKALPKGEYLYISFQVRESDTRTVCYLVRMDTLATDTAGAGQQPGRDVGTQPADGD